MLGIKQEALAMELGVEWTQKKISVLEGKEVIDADILKQVAEILKVLVEAIENMNDEQAVNIIANTFNERVFENAFANNCTFNINPIEEWIKALDENKKLYERLLDSEREKVEILKGR